MNKKKAAGITGGAAAAVAAVIIAVLGGSNIEIEYSISPKNEYVTVMSIDTPNSSEVDIAELYLNGELVDKTLLPNGEFESIPVVFKDLSRLDVKLYKLGNCIGTVNLDDKEKVVNGDA